MQHILTLPVTVSVSEKMHERGRPSLTASSSSSVSPAEVRADLTSLVIGDVGGLPWSVIATSAF